jgi:hypothetical protein
VHPEYYTVYKVKEYGKQSELVDVYDCLEHLGKNTSITKMQFHVLADVLARTVRMITGKPGVSLEEDAKKIITQMNYLISLES